MADKTISDLESVISITDDTQLLAIEDGTGTRNCTAKDIKDYTDAKISESAIITTTPAGVTTLTALSAPIEIFTGSNAQTVVLPNGTTLRKDKYFQIINNSTESLTVNFNGGSLALSMVAGSKAIFKILDVSTSAGSWIILFNNATETVSGPAEIATQSETNAGSDDTRFITSAKLANSSFNNKELVASLVISSLSSVPVLDLGNANYEIELTNLKLSVDQASVGLRMSSNNGVSYDSGGSDYDWENYDSRIAQSDSTAPQIWLNAQTAAEFNPGNAAGEYFNSEIKIYNPSLSTNKCRVRYNSTYTGSTGRLVANSGGGQRQVAKAINAIQFFPSTGIFTSGTIKVYKIK